MALHITARPSCNTLKFFETSGNSTPRNQSANTRNNFDEGEVNAKRKNREALLNRYLDIPEGKIMASMFSPTSIRIESTTTADRVQVAILAGNPRVSCNEYGKIVVEPQLQAFRAAVVRAAELRTEGIPATLSLALDHRGVFRKQFLRGGLSNSDKRNPHLLQLREEIADIFAPIAIASGIPPESILVIHEDSARTHASFWVSSGNCPEHLVRWIIVQPSKDADQDVGCVSGAGSCRYGANDTDRVTCAAVTAEYYAKAIAFGASAPRLEVFFENDPWSTVSVFVRGAALLAALGSSTLVTLNWVQKDGRIFSANRALQRSGASATTV